jgi:hypothetical protein
MTRDAADGAARGVAHRDQRCRNTMTLVDGVWTMALTSAGLDQAAEYYSGWNGNVLPTVAQGGTVCFRVKVSVPSGQSTNAPETKLLIWGDSSTVPQDRGMIFLEGAERFAVGSKRQMKIFAGKGTGTNRTAQNLVITPPDIVPIQACFVTSSTPTATDARVDLYVGPTTDCRRPTSSSATNSASGAFAWPVPSRSTFVGLGYYWINHGPPAAGWQFRYHAFEAGPTCQPWR